MKIELIDPQPAKIGFDWSPDGRSVTITELYEKCSVQDADLFIYGDPYRKISTTVDGKTVTDEGKQ